jgi:hypothetical protein
MIYPSVTTTTHNYLAQIKEAEKLGLEVVCLFLTCLDSGKRKELYKILETSSIKKIPLVHLRHDMESWELDYLWQKFNVQAFNIHPQCEYPLLQDLSKYKNHIFVEIAFAHLENFNKDVNLHKDFAGICIDFTHLEDTRLRDHKKYLEFVSEIENSICGCAHLGPIEETALPHPISGIYNYQSHFYHNLSQFDYLKNYPEKYFPEIMALEVENSLTEQIEAVNYLNQWLLP